MSAVETARGAVDTAGMTRTAVLVDFGGVITISVLQAFEPTSKKDVPGSGVRHVLDAAAAA